MQNLEQENEDNTTTSDNKDEISVPLPSAGSYSPYF